MMNVILKKKITLPILFKLLSVVPIAGFLESTGCFGNGYKKNHIENFINWILLYFV